MHPFTHQLIWPCSDLGNRATQWGWHVPLLTLLFIGMALCCDMGANNSQINLTGPWMPSTSTAWRCWGDNIWWLCLAVRVISFKMSYQGVVNRVYGKSVDLFWCGFFVPFWKLMSCYCFALFFISVHEFGKIYKFEKSFEYPL